MLLSPITITVLRVGPKVGANDEDNSTASVAVVVRVLVDGAREDTETLGCNVEEGEPLASENDDDGATDGDNEGEYVYVCIGALVVFVVVVVVGAIDVDVPTTTLGASVPWPCVELEGTAEGTPVVVVVVVVLGVTVGPSDGTPC